MQFAIWNFKFGLKPCILKLKNKNLQKKDYASFCRATWELKVSSMFKKKGSNRIDYLTLKTGFWREG